MIDGLSFIIRRVENNTRSYLRSLYIQKRGESEFRMIKSPTEKNAIKDREVQHWDSYPYVNFACNSRVFRLSERQSQENDYHTLSGIMWERISAIIRITFGWAVSMFGKAY